VLQESVNHLEDEREQFEATIADMRAQVLDQQAKISGYTREIGECARGSPSRIVRLACARALEQQPRRMIENAMARNARSNLRSAARDATFCSHLSAQHTNTRFCSDRGVGSAPRTSRGRARPCARRAVQDERVGLPHATRQRHVWRGRRGNDGKTIKHRLWRRVGSFGADKLCGRASARSA
jgi:hypothetical protein